MFPDLVYFNFWSTLRLERRPDLIAARKTIAARCPFMIFSSRRYSWLFQGSLGKNKTRGCAFANSMRATRREPNLTKSCRRRKWNAARYNGAPDKCRCASNKCREGRLLLTMSRKSGRHSTDTCASRECRSARWSQRGIAVTISDHANSGLVPFSDSCTLYEVPPAPHTSHGDESKAPRSTRPLCCVRNVVVERELNQSFRTSPVFTEVCFTEEAGKPSKMNDKITFRWLNFS